MAPPPGDGLQRLPLMPFGREQEGGRAGAAVQIFIGAADRKIGIAAVQIDRHRPGAVAQIPDRERSRGVGARSDRRHVVNMPGLVVDMGDRDRDGVFVNRVRDLVLFAQAHRHAPAGRRGDAFGNIIVGREIAALEDQHAAIGPHRHRRRQHLEQILAGRIADDDLARISADQRRELVAEPHRQVEPASAVPAFDQVGAPFLAHHSLRPRARRLRHRTQRIAVEVDHPVGQDELVAHRRQRVGAVHRLAPGAVGCFGDFDLHGIKRHGNISPLSGTFRASQSARLHAPYCPVPRRRTAWRRAGSRSNH